MDRKLGVSLVLVGEKKIVVFPCRFASGLLPLPLHKTFPRPREMARKCGDREREGSKKTYQERKMFTLKIEATAPRPRQVCLDNRPDRRVGWFIPFSFYLPFFLRSDGLPVWPAVPDCGQVERKKKDWVRKVCCAEGKKGSVKGVLEDNLNIHPFRIQGGQKFPVSC